MTTSPGSASARILRRDRDAGWIGGVAAGIARRFGIDVSLVRLAFVVATAAGGFGLGAYLLGWILIPAGESGSARSRLPTGRAAVEVALGTGLLLLAALLTLPRARHLVLRRDRVAARADRERRRADLAAVAGRAGRSQPGERARRAARAAAATEPAPPHAAEAARGREPRAPRPRSPAPASASRS